MHTTLRTTLQVTHNITAISNVVYDIEEVGLLVILLVLYNTCYLTGFKELTLTVDQDIRLYSQSISNTMP